MKKFVNRILLFLLLITAINIFFFQIVYRGYLSPYEELELEYHTYLLSDSHGLSLSKYNTENKFYNFSAGSDSYVDMKRKLQYLVENTKIKRLILTVDNHSLSAYRDNANNNDRSSFFSEISDYDNPFSYVRIRYIERLIPFVNSKSRDIVKIYFFSKIKIKEKPVSIMDLTLNERTEALQKRLKYQFPTLTKSSAQTFALNEMVDICKSNNIELIGIKYPLSREYYHRTKNLNLKADSILIINKCKVYDYSDLFIKKSDYFADHDHLNEVGGKIFTDSILQLGK